MVTDVEQGESDKKDDDSSKGGNSKTPSRTVVRVMGRSIAEIQKASLCNEKFLLNKTQRKDWQTKRGGVVSNYLLREKLDLERSALAVELLELREAHLKDENKFRNSGRKLKEEKAAVRKVEMEALLEKQSRIHMGMAEEASRRDFHYIKKYDREIERLERRNMKYHSDQCDYATLVPRILMVKLRRNVGNPALMVREVRRHNGRSEAANARARCCSWQLLLTYLLTIFLTFSLPRRTPRLPAS